MLKDIVVTVTCGQGNSWEEKVFTFFWVYVDLWFSVLFIVIPCVCVCVCVIDNPLVEG